MKILSIIIPAYNVERYLDQCLKSFEVEKILDDIEILIIDDGSKDHTKEIGKRYEEKYPDTYKVISKENGGHGSTINKGIQIAQGKYFKVIDGDDWVNKEVLEEFVQYLEKVNSDIVATDVVKVDHVTQKPIKKQEPLFWDVSFDKEYKFSEINRKAYIKMHAMTIKTSILRDNNIRITEKQFYVDAEYIFFPLPYVKTVIFHDIKLYMYRLGLPGQSMDIHKMQKNAEQHLNVLNNMLEYYRRMDKTSVETGTLQYMQANIARILVSQMKIYISFPLKSNMKQESRKLDEKIKKEFPEIYESVSNRSVWALRKTKYVLFPLAVIGFKVKSKFV